METVLDFKSYLQSRYATANVNSVRSSLGTFYAFLLTKTRFKRIISYVFKYFHHIMRIMW